MSRRFVFFFVNLLPRDDESDSISRRPAFSRLFHSSSKGFFFIDHDKSQKMENEKKKNRVSLWPFDIQRSCVNSENHWQTRLTTAYHNSG